MNHLIDPCLAFRRVFIKMIESLSDEQLDAEVPGFNNTIRWQVAHVIATQGILIYLNCGADIPILEPEFVEAVRKGTRPSESLKKDLFQKKSLMSRMEEFPQKILKDTQDLEHYAYKAYITSTGYEIDNHQSALSYSNIHDGIHLGQCSAMRKWLHQS